MSEAFGTARTIPASNTAKTQMKQLVKKGFFKEQRDAWRLGASLGISKGKTKEVKKKETFQNVNSLDPDGIFAAMMLGLYPKLTPEERLEKLVAHAEWGINEIFHQSEIGTLNFADIAIKSRDVDIKRNSLGNM